MEFKGIQMWIDEWIKSVMQHNTLSNCHEIKDRKKWYALQTGEIYIFNRPF